MKEKKEQLQIELELEKLGIDIEKIDHDLLNIIYEFIGNVYCDTKSSDQIINSDALDNYIEKLLQEGRENVNEEDT